MSATKTCCNKTTTKACRKTDNCTAATADRQAGREEDTSLLPVVWALAEKVGAGERDHQQLEQGACHSVQLQISGTVDGEPFRRNLSSIVTVGHDLTKSTSATPQQAHLVAYILGKLNQQTRDRILNDLPTEFAANDCRLPDAEQTCVLQSAELLKQLRSQKQITARRAVRCRYKFDE